MAEQYPIFNEAARTAAVLSEDEKIRQQCEAREDYYRSVGWMNDEIAHLASDLQQLTSEKQKLTSEKQKLTSENQQLTSENQHLASEIERLRQLLADAGSPDTGKN